MLRVRLLGELAVERDGAPVAPAASVRRLLAFLVLHPGPHDRDVLAARFWPDAPAGAARANLRTLVWELRRDVGAHVVLASRTSVGLAPGSVGTDVEEIATLAARGDVVEAVARCGSELLADWPQDWVRDARAAHRDRHIGLLDALAARADADGDAAAAARWSRARCALTPLDEPAHCELLRRLSAAGDRAGALVAGRELATRLREELGVAPGPATRSALARVRGVESSGIADALVRRPMFGRTGELRAAGEAWRSARAGRGRVVVVTGEGGIGKTRLVAELAVRADNVGGRVAVGAGADVGGEAPLAVWQELARELVRVVAPPPSSASWPAELGRLAPDLARALGRDEVPAPVAAPELERMRVFDAVLRLVEWAAAGRPVLLVAEDMHRADRASVALCAHIGRRVTRLPLLFVLTRRDRPVRPAADALIADLGGRGVEVTEIDLGPMGDAELAALARTVAPLDDGDVARAVRAADGNPLLAVESARALAAGGAAPPSSLRAAVRAAVGPLPRAARELVEVLAAAGRELSARELAALGTDRSEAEHHALETGLLQRGPGGLRFRHALLAEAARADLADPGRSHERAALAIEAAAGADTVPVAAEVARHLQAAGRDDLAGPRWRAAARHARSLGALPEAAAFWTEAARCDPHDALPRLELAEVRGWQGRPEEFETEWWAALDLLPEDGQSVAWSRRGTLLRTVVCNPTASLEAYRRAADGLPVDAPVSLRVEVLLGLAWGQSSVADPHRATELLDEVGALVPEPDATAVAEIESVRLMTVIRLGRFDECADIAARGGAAARRARRPDLAYPIWVNAACALSGAGDLAGALWASEEAVRATRGVAVIEQPCLAALAFLLSRLDRHDEALRVAGEQLDMAERMAAPDHEARARHDAGLVALAAGHHRAAAELLDAALHAGARGVSRPAARLARAEALARDGDPAGAAAELRRAVEEGVGPEDQPWALVPRMARVQALVALARGDREEARRRFAEAMAGWRRRRGPDLATEFMNNFVDLGRPPIVGLVEPDRELARLDRELAGISRGQEVM